VCVHVCACVCVCARMCVYVRAAGVQWITWGFPRSLSVGGVHLLSWWDEPQMRLTCNLSFCFKTRLTCSVYFVYLCHSRQSMLLTKGRKKRKRTRKVQKQIRNTWSNIPLLRLLLALPSSGPASSFFLSYWLRSPTILHLLALLIVFSVIGIVFCNLIRHCVVVVCLLSFFASRSSTCLRTCLNMCTSNVRSFRCACTSLTLYPSISAMFVRGWALLTIYVRVLSVFYSWSSVLLHQYRNSAVPISLIFSSLKTLSNNLACDSNSMQCKM